MADKIRRLFSFLGEYFDLLLAAAGGALVAIFGLTGQIEVAHLEAATLAILAASALAWCVNGGSEIVSETPCAMF